MVDIKADFENVTKIARFIDSKIEIKPTIGIVCGSGLGEFANAVENPTIFSYKDIPGFPCSTVQGHKGNLVFGKISGKNVVVMQGRFHMYEGYNKHMIAIPIRVMKLLGVHTLLLSSAVGGLNRSLKIGDLVVIKDHISLPGMSLNNVLVGKNDEEFGPRFPSLVNMYDLNLRKLFLDVTAEKKISCIHQGVYVHCGGPSYETPAECKMLLAMGGDVVGMSTAPEVVIARHCGIKVFAASVVTNVSIMDEESSKNPSHDEVLKVGARGAELLQDLFTTFIARLPIV